MKLLTMPGIEQRASGRPATRPIITPTCYLELLQYWVFLNFRTAVVLSFSLFSNINKVTDRVATRMLLPKQLNRVRNYLL